MQEGDSVSLRSAPSSERADGRDAALLAGLGGAVLALDAGCIVTYANGYARALFSPVEPLDLHVSELWALAHASNGQALAKAAQLQGGQSGAIDVAMPDGRVFDAWCTRLGQACGILLCDVSRHVQASTVQARDKLTGLATRPGLQQHLAGLLGQAGSLLPFAVLCIELDRFERVNDSLGRVAGDAVLVKLAERLGSIMRPSDLIVRLGDDKFAVVQSGVEQPRGAHALAARLIDLLGRTYLVDGNIVDLAASVGFAIAPDDGSEPATLLKHADLALHEAKAAGRATFRHFQPSMDAQIQARRHLELDLRKALALRQFALAYQPQIHIVSGALVGFEALLRWRHPERGFVSPADFIPVAEEIGLMGQLGAWVLRTACHQAASWPSGVSIAVNVSPTQFLAGGLVATVKAALASSGLSPHRLDLEITEGVLLDSTDAVLGILRELKSIGVRISMDDFGTGYSSLSYLQRFSFDKIKIDQFFVRGSDTDRDCCAIVRAIAALASSLGIQTVAEGVETQEQLERMRREGCDQVQGYLTGRPMPGAETETFTPKPALLLAKETRHAPAAA